LKSPKNAAKRALVDLMLMRIRVVRLNDLRLDGSFLCPKCHNVISQEDTNEIDSTIDRVIFDGQSEERARAKCKLRILLDLTTSLFELESTMEI